MASRILRIGLSTLFTSALVSCGSTLKQEELERVAKDWAMTIRASQVIPVYPLTEDLQPGDVFLVTTPIQEQQREYARRGFLQLDQHLTRLDGLEFAKVYGNSYGIAGHKNTPRHWQFPPDGEPDQGIGETLQRLTGASGVAPVTMKEGGASAPPADPAVERKAGSTSQPEARKEDVPHDSNGGSRAEARDDEKPARAPSRTKWSFAPRAGFPTYTFQVRSGSGATVAFPIQGVPVGLSLLQSDQATGSVTIADAHTYSVPFDKIVGKLKDWADRPENRSLLKQVRRGVAHGEPWYSRVTRFFFGTPDPTIYVRVVHRVYLAERVVVGLQNDRAFSGQASGGDPKQVEFPGIEGGKVNDNYQKALDTLNKKLDTALPGGTVKIAYATHRSVSMSETFDRPLVIGFLGFDFPVTDEGRLGAPIATLHQVQTGTLTTPEELETPYATTSQRDLLNLMYGDLSAHRPNLEALQKLDGEAAKALPSKYPVPIFAPGPGPSEPLRLHAAGEALPTSTTAKSFEVWISYLGQLGTSLEVLKKASGARVTHIGQEPEQITVADTAKKTEAERTRVAAAVPDALSQLLDTYRTGEE